MFWRVPEAQKTTIFVLELIENAAIFRLSWVSFHWGMNVLGDSKGSENGDFCTGVTLKRAIFRLSWGSSRLGMSFLVKSRSSEDGDFCTRVN